MNSVHDFPIAAVGREQLYAEQFQIAAVKVNNPSGMWLYIPEARINVPPQTIGFVQNIEPSISSIRFQFVNPPQGGVANVASGGPISVTLYDAASDVSPGLPYTTANSQDVANLQTAIAGVQASVDTGNASQATAAKQDAAQTSLTALQTGQAAQATAAKQDTAQTSLGNVDANTKVGGNLDTKLGLVAKTTDLATLATSAKQDTAQTSLGNVDANTKVGGGLDLKLQTIISNTQPINSALVNFTAAVAITTTLIRTAVGREVIVIYNPSPSITVYIGSSTVTIANGTPILPGEKHVWAINNISLYGISASGTITLQCTRGALT